MPCTTMGSIGERTPTSPARHERGRVSLLATQQRLDEEHAEVGREMPLEPRRPANDVAGSARAEAGITRQIADGFTTPPGRPASGSHCATAVKGKGGDEWGGSQTPVRRRAPPHDMKCAPRHPTARAQSYAGETWERTARGDAAGVDRRTGEPSSRAVATRH